MREIKFRAWNGKSFYKPIISDGLIYRDYRDFEDNIYFEDALCQYTGIKDKNGKEIYEGDILNVPSIDNYELGVVKFGDHRDAFNGWYVQWKNNQGELNHSWTELGEVVGNIYENPNLPNQTP